MNDDDENTNDHAPGTTDDETGSQDEGEGLLAAINEAVEAESVQPDEDEAADDEAPSTDEPGTDEPATPDDAQGADDAAQAKPDAEPATKPDHLHDPIPDDIKGRTRERMEGLVKSVKEVSTERDKVKAERDEVLGMITETGATPEQFGSMLGFLKQSLSDSPAEKRKALAFLRQGVQALAVSLGEPVEGVDLLSQYDDLREEVESGDLTHERALEIAAARASKEAATKRSEQSERESTEQREHTASIERGRTALNALEDQLKADPDYQRKRTVLVPALQAVMAQVHPSRWAETFKRAYDQVQLPAAPAGVPRNQPMRPKQPAGQGTKQAATLEEAIAGGIERASRR